MDEGFRADLLVEGKLLIELKSVERTAPVYMKQVLTYLRLMGLPLGLLMNFGAATFREGIRRVANSRGAISFVPDCPSLLSNHIAVEELPSSHAKPQSR